jgi:hypothetical protein
MPALSYVETTGDGSNATFSFASLDLFLDTPKKDQIDVYVNGQIQTYTTHYTVSGTNVVFESGFIPANGTTVKIARDTQIDDKIVTFANSSILTAADLNKNTDQLLFLAQELDDAITNLALTTAGSIADGSITENKLSQSAGDEAVVTDAIRDGAVQTAKINDLAVTTAKIGDSAVTEPKLAFGCVTSGKLNSTLYQTGTWLPEVKAAVGFGGLSPAIRASTFNYTSRNGYYVKIGRLVTYWFSISGLTLNASVNGLQTDQLAITLPPLTIPESVYMGATVSWASNWQGTAPRTGLVYFVSSTPYIGLFGKGGAGNSVATTLDELWNGTSVSIIMYGSYISIP